MGSYNYSFSCECPDSIELMSITMGDARAWKNLVTYGEFVSICDKCGCTYRFVDDNLPVDAGGGIKAKNESRPRITSIVSGKKGSVHGGVKVTIMGHALIHTTPTIMFNGVPSSSVTTIDETYLECIAPPGSVEVNLHGDVHWRLAHGPVSGGPFGDGELVSGTSSGAYGTISAVGVNHIYVRNITGKFSDGEEITTSGAYSDLVSGFSDDQFVVGETITGMTSGDTGVVVQAMPLRISGTTGPFSPGEDIQGKESGARGTLSHNDPFNGLVDVTIKNSFGVRESGHCLPNAFEYKVS